MYVCVLIYKFNHIYSVLSYDREGYNDAQNAEVAKIRLPGIVNKNRG